MPGILDYKRYLELFYTVRDIQEHFPLEQLTVNYTFNNLGTDGWLGDLSWQTFIVDRVPYRFGEPDFRNSIITGYFPAGTRTFAVSGQLQLPASMYTGPIIPDSLENVPVTLVDFTFTKGTEVFSQQLLLIENWQPGVPIGDPTLDPAYVPVIGAASTLVLTAQPSEILLGDQIVLTAVSDVPQITVPNAQVYYYRRTGLATSSLLGTAGISGSTSTFTVNTENLSTGTQTFFATFVGNPNYREARSNDAAINIIPGKPLQVDLSLSPNPAVLNNTVSISATAQIAPGFASTASQYIDTTASFSLTALGTNSGESQNPVNISGTFTDAVFSSQFTVSTAFLPTSISSSTYTVNSFSPSGNNLIFDITQTKQYRATLNWGNNFLHLIRPGSTSSTFTVNTSQNVVQALEPLTVSVVDSTLNVPVTQIYTSTQVRLQASSNIGRIQNTPVEFWSVYSSDYNVADFVIPRTPRSYVNTSTGTITLAVIPDRLNYTNAANATTGSTFTLAGVVNTGSTNVVYRVYQTGTNVLFTDPPWNNHISTGSYLTNRTISVNNPATDDLLYFETAQITELEYTTGLGVPYFTGAYNFNRVKLNSANIRIGSTFKLQGNARSPIDTTFTIVSGPDLDGFYTINPAYSLTSYQQTEQWRRDNEIWNNFNQAERNRTIVFYDNPYDTSQFRVEVATGLGQLKLENIPSNLRVNSTFVSSLTNFAGTYTVTALDPLREIITISPAWTSASDPYISQWAGSTFSYSNAAPSTSTVFLGTATAINTATDLTTTWSLTRTLNTGSYQITARINPTIQTGAQAPFRYPTTSTQSYGITSASGLTAPFDIEYQLLDAINTNTVRIQISIVCRGAVSQIPEHYYVFDQPVTFYDDNIPVATANWTRVGQEFEQRAVGIITVPWAVNVFSGYPFNWPTEPVLDNFEVRWPGNLNSVFAYPDQFRFRPATITFIKQSVSAFASRAFSSDLAGNFYSNWDSFTYFTEWTWPNSRYQDILAGITESQPIPNFQDLGLYKFEKQLGYYNTASQFITLGNYTDIPLSVYDGVNYSPIVPDTFPPYTQTLSINGGAQRGRLYRARFDDAFDNTLPVQFFSTWNIRATYSGDLLRSSTSTNIVLKIPAEGSNITISANNQYQPDNSLNPQGYDLGSANLAPYYNTSGTWIAQGTVYVSVEHAQNSAIVNDFLNSGDFTLGLYGYDSANWILLKTLTVTKNTLRYYPERSQIMYSLVYNDSWPFTPEALEPPPVPFTYYPLQRISLRIKCRFPNRGNQLRVFFSNKPIKFGI